MQSNDVLTTLREFGISFDEKANKWSLHSSNDLHSFLASTGIKGFYPFGIRKLNLDDFFSGRLNFELDPIEKDIHEMTHLMCKLIYDDTFVHSENYFEQIVSFEGGLRQTRYIATKKLKIPDDNSGIEYELSRPSLEYILLSFQKFFEEDVNSIIELPSLVKEAFFDSNEYIQAINEEERFKNNVFRAKKSVDRPIKYNFQITASKLLIEIRIVESEFDTFLEILDALKLFKDLGETNTDKLTHGLIDGFEDDIIKKFNRYKRYYRKLDHNNVNKRIESYERRKLISERRLRRLKNFENFLSEGIFRNVWTLKVRSKNDLELEEFENLSNSFLFYLNYNDLPVFKIYPRLFESLKSDYYSEFNFKHYKKELVYYYHRGLKTDDPTLSFLSFYHVIEFYCKKFADHYSVEDVRKFLNDPNFSAEDEKKIIKLINNIQRAQKRLNDKIRIQLVIEAYLDEKDILDLLNNYHTNDINHFKQLDKNDKSIKTNFEVLINKYPLINKNEDLMMENLVGRVYAIRNALVHSKEGEEYAFVPFSGDEYALKKEIPLMRFLAEQIIIKTSKNFDL